MKIIGAAAAVWSVYLVVAASDGAEFLLDYFVFFYGALFLPGIWLLATAYRLWSSEARKYLTRARHYVVPLVVLVTWGSLSSDAPFWLRFRLSESKLEQFATSYRGGTQFDIWVGLFKVKWCDSVGDSVRMVTGYCGIDLCGIVYDPDGAPPVEANSESPDEYDDYYWPIDGPWWYWQRRF